jgi:hypothetical protein
MRNLVSHEKEETLDLYTQHSQPEMRGEHNQSTKVTRRRNLPAGVVVIMRAIA